MAKEQGVVIEQAKTGIQYGVSVADFKKHYEEQGFKIISNEDGSPYGDAPAKASSTAMTKEERNARKAAAAREKRAAKAAEKAATVAPSDKQEGE